MNLEIVSPSSTPSQLLLSTTSILIDGCLSLRILSPIAPLCWYCVRFLSKLPLFRPWLLSMASVAGTGTVRVGNGCADIWLLQMPWFRSLLELGIFAPLVFLARFYFFGLKTQKDRIFSFSIFLIENQQSSIEGVKKWYFSNHWSHYHGKTVTNHKNTLISLSLSTPIWK